ncbi:cellular tumor antigen p53-like isoform X1 [Tigriopus californicus]|nr:cellular tumor antigen p53-like isoform X1 [Tigriopus californicus]
MTSEAHHPWGDSTTPATEDHPRRPLMMNMGFDPVLNNGTTPSQPHEISPLESLSPTMMWLSPEDETTLRSNLIKDGHISSDGELTIIAQREADALRAHDFTTLLKTEDEADPVVAQEMAHTSMPPGSIIVNPSMLKHEAETAESGEAGGVVTYLWQASECPNMATGVSPSTQDWSGHLGFDLRIPPASKSKDGQYSKMLHKLFINQNRVVHVHFNVRNREDMALPEGLMIRAVVIYTRPDDFGDPVHVCPSHSKDSLGQLKSPHADHLIRCNSERSMYILDPVSKRHSVVTEVNQPQPGCNEVVLGYRFMDLGSCAGGLNRRDTAVIFTLELGGNVVGRKILPLRICTCPKRDMESEEKSGKKNGMERLSDQSHEACHPGKVKIDKRQPKWVLTYGEENFQIVKNLAEGLVKKDGGDVEKWRESIKTFNDLTKKSCKRSKLSRPDAT